MRLLSIEDDPIARTALKEELAPRYAIDFAKGAKEGSYMAKTNDYDLIILDYMMPEKDGLEVIKDIRDAGKTMPILVLSAIQRIEIKVKCMDAGADDYLCKPYAPSELATRIRVLLRRPRGIQKECLEIADLSLDTKSQCVERAGESINLTMKEFNMLEYLMRNEDEAISQSMLLEHAWERFVDPFTNTVPVHIMSLRRKIDKPGLTKLIHTVSGRGYKIMASNEIVKAQH